jgi:C4-dicarboxylate transporter
MFGYNPIQLYFLTNCIYTIIMFFFLHNSIVDKVIKNHHRMTQHHMTDEEIMMTMNIFYVVGPFFGSLKLFRDTLNFIFDHKSSLWLHWLYKDKE